MNFDVSPAGSGELRVMSNGVFGSAPIALFARPNPSSSFAGWSSSSFISNAPSGMTSPVQFYRFNVPASFSSVTANFNIDYGVTLSESGTYGFSSVIAGYSPISGYPITVTNIGSTATGALNVALSGADRGSF
jgi:hypothetical protein